ERAHDGQAIRLQASRFAGRHRLTAGDWRLVTFQTKLFAAATVAAAIALAVAGALVATSTVRRTDERIEQTLVAEARLAADLLAREAPAPRAVDETKEQIGRFDPEADRIGE